VARAGLPRTTVHRIRGALEQEEFVTVDAVTGRLHLGPGLLSLAVASRRDLSTAVDPYLARLSSELNETVALSVLDGIDVLCIAQHAAPQRALMAVSRVGARFPAFCTANGEALLAQLPLGEVERRLPKRLESPAWQTPVAREDVLRELDEVRRTGRGFDREEHQAGICSTGVAIADIDGSAASISVLRPTARFRADADVVSAALLRVRDEVQIVLGAADGCPGHDR